MSNRTISRRAVTKWLVGAPAVGVAACAAATAQPAPAPAAPAAAPSLGACLAAQDATLSADERARAEKGIAGLQSTLKKVRDFRVPDGADPAFRFAALKSPGRR